MASSQLGAVRYCRRRREADGDETQDGSKLPGWALGNGASGEKNSEQAKAGVNRRGDVGVLGDSPEARLGNVRRVRVFEPLGELYLGSLVGADVDGGFVMAGEPAVGNPQAR
jgi:hypothetical protein